MVDIYLWLFIAICTGLLGWGITQPERVYQYPFFMGSIFVSFILPQAIALINNPGVVSPEALERVLLMSCLCAAMCWVGYQFKPNIKFLKKLDITIDYRKLFQAGITLTIVGYFFEFLILRTNPTVSKAGTWTGVITIYGFFFSVIYIAFGILMTLTLRRPNAINILLTIIAAYPILGAAFGAGRRQGVAALILTIGLSLFYVRRYLPPKWMVIAATVLSVYLIPLIGASRGEFWSQIFSLNFSQIDWTGSLAHTLKGEVLELRNAAIFIDAAEKTDQYGYGTGYWDFLVFRFVPAQLLGKAFKESLQFKLSEYDLGSSFDYFIPTGSTNTGIGDAFREFSYFGCLFFAFQAYFFKHIYSSAICQNSIFSQLFYIGLITPAMLNITHGTLNFFPDLLFQVIFLGFVIIYSR